MNSVMQLLVRHRHLALDREHDVIWRIFRSYGAALAILASCGGAPLARAAQEPVDPTYRSMVDDGRNDADPYQLYLFVKAVEQQGKLRVCAGYVAEMSDTRFDRLMAALRHPSSFLRIGAADAQPYRMRPNFFAGTRTMPVEPTSLGERLPRSRMRAGCIDTDATWRDDYATGEMKLGLCAKGGVRLGTVPGFGKRF
jgi:hypothetical protein